METTLQRIAKARENAVVAGRGDPTRTIVLRTRFAAEATRRFRKIKKLIWESIVVNDAFGLKMQVPLDLSGLLLRANVAIPRQSFAFKTDTKKVQEFMGWLNVEVNHEIFQVAGPTRAVVGNVAWANTYIDTAYKRGMKRADSEMVKAGIPTSRYAPPGRAGLTVEAAFNTPFHADKVGMIYTRTYSSLKGISDSMESTISRELAQGLAEGRSPMTIARSLNNAIEQAGGSLALTDARGTPLRAIQRARILARTEVIRAHHIGMINTYKEAGLEGVSVKAEWMTAGDDRVCADCESMEGLIFTLEKIENLIPLHPQCRCVALPYIGKIGKPAGMERIEKGVYKPKGSTSPITPTKKTPEVT